MEGDVLADPDPDELTDSHSLDEGEKTKYCLYTNTYFGDIGISILARPADAPRIAELLLDVYHSAFPSPGTVQYLNLTPAYEIVDMPHKGGKGMVATRRIARKETFLIDYAAITGNLNMWGSVSLSGGRELLEATAEQLLDADQVKTLSHGAGGEGMEGVLRSNTFRTALHGIPQKMLFPKISVRLALCPSMRRPCG